MTLTPEERSSIALQNIDTSDCGVIALQAVTTLPREEAVELAASVGYVAGVGMKRGSIEDALGVAGIETVAVPPEEFAHDSVATFALSHEYGDWLVYCTTEKAGHVMALIDGDLHNSRAFWSFRVDEATRVVR